MNIKYIYFTALFVAALNYLRHRAYLRKEYAEMKKMKIQNSLLLLHIRFIDLGKVLYPKSESIENFRQNI